MDTVQVEVVYRFLLNIIFIFDFAFIIVLIFFWFEKKYN